MTASFSIEHDQDGGCHYELRTRAGETVISGPSFPSERACKRGIYALQGLVARAALPADEAPHRIVGSDAASSA
jgi:uncharacterized protein YegP (UPF0339 family)